MDYTQDSLADAAIAAAVIGTAIWFMATIGQWGRDSEHTLLDVLRRQWRCVWGLAKRIW